MVHIPFHLSRVRKSRCWWSQNKAVNARDWVLCSRCHCSGSDRIRSALCEKWACAGAQPPQCGAAHRNTFISGQMGMTEGSDLKGPNLGYDMNEVKCSTKKIHPLAKYSPPTLSFCVLIVHTYDRPSLRAAPPTLRPALVPVSLPIGKSAEHSNRGSASVDPIQRPEKRRR